ncbi:MAG TPA: enoyl-CoA hydratase [Terriglobales bacterium]|nr:enoyl-CoA hydratase [Terriglobales bacterium]
MPTQETIYEVADGVATITLNRPDKLNAWTATMEQEVRSAVEEAERDENARVIVLTGAGRGFCAGADMSLLNTVATQGLPKDVAQRIQSGDAAQEGQLPDFQRKYSYFLGVAKPVIAAINGPAVGLGFVIPLYCDLRWAAENARFSTVFAQRGLIAEYGIAWMLPRIVGLSDALDLLFSARTITASDALDLRLVNRVFPQDGVGFGAAVHDQAAKLAASVSPRSLGVIKRQVYTGMFQTLAEAFDLSVVELVASLQSEDFKEGVAHFLEKRAPKFSGR